MEEAMRHVRRLLPLLLFVLPVLLLGACEVAPTATPTIPFPTVPPVSSPEPTAVPPPTAPPTVPTPPAECTDKASFDSDVSVPPGTVFLPGQPFVKTWRLRNTGTCTWTGDYELVFYSGDRMAGAMIAPLPGTVTPGNTIDLSVALVAPAGAGTYEGRWLLRNARSELFGIVESADGTFGVRIVVETSPPAPTTGTVTPTVTPQATVMPTAGPTPVITDWRGEYYGNPDLAGNPTLVRNDVAIDFDWQGAPADGLPADGFSVRWTRVFSFEAGPYRFHAVVDDGVRLWVDDHLVLDEWRDGGQREVIGDWTVLAGNHTVRIEFYDRAGRATIHAWWDKNSSIYPDWEGQYWANADLSGAPVLVQNEGAIDFNWGTGSIAGGMPTDNFSARWMRIASFDAGTYRFHVVMDDAARMWVDNNLIVDSWRDGAAREVTADVTMTSGPHLLRVEYYERGGEAQIHAWWEKLSAGPTPSPSPPPTPGASAVWRGRYWANMDFRGQPKLVRNSKAIDFDWGTGAPAPEMPADHFSIRWERSMSFAPGTYVFHAQADNGVRFYLDGSLLLDEWYSSGKDVYDVDAALDGPHTLVVEY
jgi:hypothetical protein